MEGGRPRRDLVTASIQIAESALGPRLHISICNLYCHGVTNIHGSIYANRELGNNWCFVRCLVYSRSPLLIFEKSELLATDMGVGLDRSNSSVLSSRGAWGGRLCRFLLEELTNRQWTDDQFRPPGSSSLSLSYISQNVVSWDGSEPPKTKGRDACKLTHASSGEWIFATQNSSAHVPFCSFGKHYPIFLDGK